MEEVKRINLNLPEKTYDRIVLVGKQLKLNMTYTIRFALGLLLLLAEETTKNGNKLAVVDKDGKMIKEIVIPSQ